MSTALIILGVLVMLLLVLLCLVVYYMPSKIQCGAQYGCEQIGLKSAGCGSRKPNGDFNCTTDCADENGKCKNPMPGDCGTYCADKDDKCARNDTKLPSCDDESIQTQCHRFGCRDKCEETFRRRVR